MSAAEALARPRLRSATRSRLGVRAFTGLLVALLLGGGLVLRLWGLRHGLPFAYNTDENLHFVPKAIGMFTQGANPHYFVNPPALTYVLHAVFAVLYGGARTVGDRYAGDPTAVFTTARATVAVLSTASIGFTYLAGARLLGRRAGLLAAALMAVCFLSVFYAHEALNDAVTPALTALALWGAARALTLGGRARDFVLAGVGVGLAAAVKYTGGIAVIAVVGVASVTFVRPRGERRALVGLVCAGVAALVAFVIANPYALLDFSAFKYGIVHQSTVSEEAGGKLGAPHTGGIAYYLWAFTWGLGWAPSIASVLGAIALVVDRRRRALLAVLAPTPLLFLAFMGTEGRYFGRWLLPIIPFVCVLAAYAAIRLGELVRRPVARHAIVALASAGLLAQGVVYCVHSDLVLSRPDTRNLARAWMVSHIPVGSHIVVEPMFPATWVQDPGHPLPSTPNGDRWLKYPSLLGVVDPDGRLDTGNATVVNIEDYERTLAPALLPYYRQHGYCWVVSGTDQAGRAFADPSQVPRAIAYYTALTRQATVAYSVTPYAPGARAVPFNFDTTFNYYDLGFTHAGPRITIYRLHGGRCARHYPGG